jgi:hypothetical protein
MTVDKSDAISMKEAKEKLMNLELENDVDDIMKEFGKFLSPRLNDELVPAGFVLGCTLALYDLSVGVNGYTGEQIRNRLVGYPPIMYALIRMRFMDIAYAVFPESFANDVRDFIEKTKNPTKEPVKKNE